MPISVLCPSCKARFSVSEKFAGKKGPCPKCKTQITVPEISAEEVTIHVPEEFASGGKDSKGRAVLKPEKRKDLKAKPLQIAIIATVVVVILGAAVAIRLSKQQNNLLVIIPCLVLVSPLLTAAPYTFLRNDEAEPFRGKELWLRAAACAVGYIVFWGLYYELRSYDIITGESWQWVVAAPVFGVLGGFVALGCFDLEFGNGVFHYFFYVAATLILRFAVGMPPIWTSPISPTRR